MPKAGERDEPLGTSRIARLLVEPWSPSGRKPVASMPAVLHFLQGEAKLTLGDDTLEARPGTWVHMAKGLRHSIRAKKPVVMLLLLVKELRP